MRSRYFYLIPAIVLGGAMGGCGADESPPAPTLAISPTATMHGTLPDLAGTLTVMVGDTPASITANTWSATLPLPADQVPVVLTVDGEEFRRVLIDVR